MTEANASPPDAYVEVVFGGARFASPERCLVHLGRYVDHWPGFFQTFETDPGCLGTALVRNIVPALKVGILNVDSPAGRDDLAAYHSLTLAYCLHRFLHPRQPVGRPLGGSATLRPLTPEEVVYWPRPVPAPPSRLAAQLPA